MDTAARRLGPLLHGTSLGAVALSLGLWIRAKTVTQEERANAERRALFVGLWPAMFWLIGDAAERAAQRRVRSRWRRAAVR
jgi:hypothetical protein